MSYFITYDDNRVEQNILDYDSFTGLQREYSGIIGELLIEFIYSDFSKYNRAFQIIDERFKSGIYKKNEYCFWYDARHLEYFLSNGDNCPSILGEDWEIERFKDGLFDSFMKKHNLTNINDFNRELVRDLEEKDWEKIKTDTEATLALVDKKFPALDNKEEQKPPFIFEIKLPHLYFKTISSDSYNESMHISPCIFMHRANYKYLQDFYLNALKFCFNIDQKYDLKELSLVQRLYLFGELYDRHLILANKYGDPSTQTALTYLYSNLPEYDNDMFQNKYDSQEELELDNQMIEYVKSLQLTMEKYISMNDPYTACFLEFMKIIESNITIKKCKNCDKLFVVTEGYNIEYCNRTPIGENKSCREIGAVRTYSEKVKNDPILEAYNRAYKTHFARIRYKIMTKGEFNIWALNAKDMKNKAKSGELTLEEFKEWLKK